MAPLKEILELDTAKDFWRWLAKQAREKAAETASERVSDIGALYAGYAEQQVAPDVLAPPVVDLPVAGSFADVDPTGLVTIHIPPASIVSVDTAGNVAFGIPKTAYQISAQGQVLLNYYQANQQAIAQQVAQDVYNIWGRYVNHDKFMQGWGAVNDLIQQSINQFFKAAEANSARFYGSSRAVSGFGHIEVPGITLDPKYLDSVTQIMGPGQFFNHLENNNDAQVASDMTRDGMQGSAQRLVLNGGRDTITNVSTQDKAAEGWERVIEPGACSFCAMLAGRGGVYKESTVDFRAHDHCHCVARPVFKGQESINQDLSEAWGRETKGTHGKHAIAAWGKYWEGRGSHVESEQRHAEGTEGERSGHAAVAGERER